jgi:hypothetical protein
MSASRTGPFRDEMRRIAADYILRHDYLSRVSMITKLG